MVKRPTPEQAQVLLGALALQGFSLAVCGWLRGLAAPLAMGLVFSIGWAFRRGRALSPPLSHGWIFGFLPGFMLAAAAQFVVILDVVGRSGEWGVISLIVTLLDLLVVAALLSALGLVPAKGASPAPAQAAAARPSSIPQDLSHWVRANVAGPLSTSYAALAAAIRTLEDGYDMSQARSAALVAAHAWAPPAGVSLVPVTIQDLEALKEWKSIPYTVLSQRLATQAAVLRALESGKDMASVIESGQAAANAWSPNPRATKGAGRMRLTARAAMQIFGNRFAFWRAH